MTREQFWALVELSLLEAAAVPPVQRRLLRRGVPRRPGERHVLALERLLAALPDAALVSFQEHLDLLRAEAFTWDLWGAGYVACGGMSDDAFTDLRTWLVSQGPAAHRRVTGDPDALADIAPPDLDERLADAETWGYVALEVWDGRHDEDMPRPGVGPATDPAGEPFDEASLAARYPRLAARYGP